MNPLTKKERLGVDEDIFYKHKDVLGAKKLLSTKRVKIDGGDYVLWRDVMECFDLE